MPYACPPCQLILVGQEALAAHMESCVRSERWSCPVCSHEFATADDVARHVERMDHLVNADSSSGDDGEDDDGDDGFAEDPLEGSGEGASGGSDGDDGWFAEDPLEDPLGDPLEESGEGASGGEESDEPPIASSS